MGCLTLTATFDRILHTCTSRYNSTSAPRVTAAQNNRARHGQQMWYMGIETFESGLKHIFNDHF